MPLSSGFQSQVNGVPVPGIEGDFSSLNPFYTFPAGPGGLVAGDSLSSGGAGGVLVGRFVWPSYSILDPALEALAAALWGEQACPGQLPIAIPGQYPLGHGAHIVTW